MALTREQVEAKKGVRSYKTVQVGDEEYRLQSMTEKEKAEYEFWFLDKTGKPNTEKQKANRQALLVRCLVDDAGNRLFADNEEAILEDLCGSIVSKLTDEALALCGYGKTDENLAKKFN